jgi:hypothetical protein
MTGNLVERRLGAATARLHAEIGAIWRMTRSAERAAQPTARALVAISLDLLCGAYHDYRSGVALPKGDLITALRAVPGHPATSDAVAALVTRLVCGEFAETAQDGSAWLRARRRFSGEHWPIRRGPPVPVAAIDLTPSEARAHVWIYRYVEVYGVGPTHNEMGAGLGTSSIAVNRILRRLEHKGAVTSIGGHRGWLPTRAP